MRRRRISRLAYCCGLKYWRWRFEGAGRFCSGERCARCGHELRWQQSPGTQRATWLRYYYRRRERALAAGLTTKGRPRTRPGSRSSPAVERVAHLQRYHQRAARRAAMGLTTRGTVRRYRERGWRSEPERQWAELRAGMVVPVVEFLSPLERGEVAA